MRAMPLTMGRRLVRVLTAKKGMAWVLALHRR